VAWAMLAFDLWSLGLSVQSMAKVICERQSWQEGDGYTTGREIYEGGLYWRAATEAHYSS